MKKLLLALAFLALAIPANAQGFGGMFPGPGTPHSTGGGSGIAFDNAASPGSNGGSGNLSVSYTGASLTNGLLVACVVGANTVDSVTGMTYNGVAMTFGGKFGNPQSFGRWIYQYYLLNPASGSHTFAVTQTGGDYLIPVLGEYSGVKQSGQLDAGPVTNTSASSPISASVTIAHINSWAIGCAQTGSTGVYSDGTGGKFRISDTPFIQSALYDSNAGEPTGAYSLAAAHSVGNLGLVLTSFQPN